MNPVTELISQLETVLQEARQISFTFRKNEEFSKTCESILFHLNEAKTDLKAMEADITIKDLK